MNLTTYPLNNVTYSAEDAELFHATRTSGIFAGSDFGATVNGSDNDVTIGTGIGWIKNGDFSGKVVALKEATTLTLDLADPVYPRIDAIILQFSATNNATSLVVKSGTASSSPIAPDVIRTGSIYELHLYHVLRPAGASVITAANVTDLRLDPAYCGLMADSVTSVDTSVISEQINQLINNLQEEIGAVKDGSAYVLKSETISIENGGTGGTTQAEALENLGAVSKTGDTITGNLLFETNGSAIGQVFNTASGTSFSVRAQAPYLFIVQDNVNSNFVLVYNGATKKITSIALPLDTIGYMNQCTDPDTITESGFYYMTASTTNAPTTSGYMLAAFMANGRGTQIAAVNGASSNFWIRSNMTGSGGGWQTWRKIVTTDMFSYSGGTLTITM